MSYEATNGRSGGPASGTRGGVAPWINAAELASYCNSPFAQDLGQRRGVNSASVEKGAGALTPVRSDEGRPMARALSQTLVGRGGVYSPSRPSISPRCALGRIWYHGMGGSPTLVRGFRLRSGPRPGVPPLTGRSRHALDRPVPAWLRGGCCRSNESGYESQDRVKITVNGRSALWTRVRGVSRFLLGS